MMNRRAYLGTVSGAIAFTAGCTSSNVGDIVPDAVDPDPELTEAGLAPNPIDVDEMEVTEDDFEIGQVEATQVKRVPLDVAVYWYHTHKARFVDARSIEDFESAHITGAVSSSAPNGVTNDATNDFGENERVVTYCTCPHYLSGVRAHEFNREGIAAYALEPGLAPWNENGHPMTGPEQANVENHDPDYSITE